MIKVIRQFLRTSDLKKVKEKNRIDREITKKNILKKIETNKKSKEIYLHNLVQKIQEIGKTNHKCQIKSYQNPKLVPKK